MWSEFYFRCIFVTRPVVVVVVVVLYFCCSPCFIFTEVSKVFNSACDCHVTPLGGVPCLAPVPQGEVEAPEEETRRTQEARSPPECSGWGTGQGLRERGWGSGRDWRVSAAAESSSGGPSLADHSGG